MIIKLDENAKAYLEKTGTQRLLIDMTPDMTNSGCGCGKSKKFYTPYIRALRTDEKIFNCTRFEDGQVEIFLSPKAIEASEDLVTVKLEKNLFMKKLELEGIRFLVEE